MTDEIPWWRPIADALAKKVAKVITDYPTSTDYEMGLEKQIHRVIDADFQDLPAKAPRTRRKALPAPPDPNVTGKAPIDEK